MSKPALAKVNTFKSLTLVRKDCAMQLLDSIIEQKATISEFSKKLSFEVEIERVREAVMFLLGEQDWTCLATRYLLSSLDFH